MLTAEIGEPHKASTGTLLKLNAHPASTLKALVADHINKEHHVWYDFVKSDAGDSIARFSNALYPGSLVQLMMHANLVETREGERSGLIGILPVIPSTCVRIKSSSVDMMIGDFGHLSIPGEAELIYELAKKEYQDGRTYYTIAVWLLWLLKM
ncbi:hypothetical protein BCR37DRAFT_387291 [Protomyces lactucae-debilis]|uniref:Uncharacterized protein n=1 Tax=Protomyces lactucae-debilis TaxID=2754530 RepID=A0A1Y2FGS8_PROLT|nr:uncharacterized protein BCR37DRAFT_387291 [Protomyces lactucae-debilis]ORY82614.1 hypothetical protein BCR37DRAFT_387291 [Protomyces lactucae-debilis]